MLCWRTPAHIQCEEHYSCDLGKHLLDGNAYAASVMVKSGCIVVANAETKKDTYEFKRDIIIGGEDPRTGKTNAEKVIRLVHTIEPAALLSGKPSSTRLHIACA